MCRSFVHTMKKYINLFSRNITIYCTLIVKVLWTKISTQNVMLFSSYAVSVVTVRSYCPIALADNRMPFRKCLNILFRKNEERLF